MRLINLDELMKYPIRLNHFDKENGDINFVYGIESVLEYAKYLPIIDTVPVRHGKWICEWETEDTRMLRCSECRMVFNVGKGRDGNYCPNCGAKMDVRKEE